MKRKYNVCFDFNRWEIVVTASSIAEAKKKAFEKLKKFSYNKLIDNNKTYIEKEE